MGNTMADNVVTKGKTGKRVPTKIKSHYEVSFLQEDMKGFKSTLQYSINRSMEGSYYLDQTSVEFGEMWIYDIKRKIKYSGIVKVGRFYLPQKDGKYEGPITFKSGKYKVWLDAWINLNLYYADYGGTPQFHSADGTIWSPPNTLPDLKHWQTINIKNSKDGKVQYLYVKSRRFHWFFRIDLILGSLKKVLKKYEALSKDALSLVEMANIMRHFLYILEKSDANLARYDDHWRKMMSILYNLQINTEEWIQGHLITKPALLEEIKHINNIAALLWHFVENRDFANSLRAWDEQLPDEARIILSLLGPAFARVPMAFDIPPYALPNSNATNYSPNWGKRFVEELYIPFFAEKRKELGLSGPPAFSPGNSKSQAIPKVLDSCRKYIVGTLNGISVFLLKQASAGVLLLGGHWNELIKLIETDRSIPSISRLLGSSEYDVAEAMRLFDLKMQVGRDISNLEAELDKASEKAAKEREKLTTILGKTNPCIIYFLESFEVGVKGWIMVLSYKKLVEEGRKDLPRNLIDALGSTANFTGSAMKSTTLAKILKARGISPKEIEVIGKWGRGLAFAADSVVAGIFIYDTWYADNSLKGEVINYTSNDAKAVEYFYIGIAGGKVITAIGSVMTLTGIGAIPGVVLQGAGYALQFAGEFLAELWRIGASEKKMWGDMVNQLRSLYNILIQSRREHYQVDYLSPEHLNYLKSQVDDFKWGDINPKLWSDYVNSFATN